MTDGVSTTSYTYDAAERTAQAGSTTFFYDNNGNQVFRTEQGGTTTDYSCDFEDRLVKASSKSYQRDALGRAVSSREGSTKTEYVFDGPRVTQEKTGYYSYLLLLCCP